MVKYFLNTNIEFVKIFFRDNIAGYQIINESSNGPFWNVRFSKNEIEINVSGDIGFSVEVFIGKTKYELWQYDRSVNEVMQMNEKNIKYQLNVLKRFLSEDSI